MIEYVPVEVDIAEVVKPVYRLRPDNSQLVIVKDVQTLDDVINNSASYLYAWGMWQTYAEALEKVITGIEETYGPDSGTSAQSHADDP